MAMASSPSLHFNALSSTRTRTKSYQVSRSPTRCCDNSNAVLRSTSILAFIRRGHVSERKQMVSCASRIVASVADIPKVVSCEKTHLPKGDMWSVHKFGGTCMGSSERIQNVANIIVNDDSERKVVVVSAMSKVTDMMYSLIHKAQSRDESYVSALDELLEKHKLTALKLLDGDDLASFISKLQHDINSLKDLLRAIFIAGHVTESFSDFVVGYGELWSAEMLSYVIRKLGVECNWMDTRDVIIVNPTGSNQVDPDFLESERKLEEWFSRNPSKTIIATGFIVNTPQNIPTTLKRDGSDFSASILGALFRARKVTIWTDVDGVYSADPRKVHGFKNRQTSPKTSPKFGRSLLMLRSPGDENGDGQRLESLVKGFATIDNVALINVEGTGMVGVPGTANEIFSAVKDVGANASSEHSVCFAVPEDEVNDVAKALQSRFRQALDAGRLSQVEVIQNCSILAAVGQKMASTPGVSASLFTALAKANINIRAIAQGCSEYNITVVLRREDSIKALRAVHSRFYLSKTTMAMGIIGPGLIGATLLDQLKDQAKKCSVLIDIMHSHVVNFNWWEHAAVLKDDFNIDLRVLGIASSTKMVLSETGFDLREWRDAFKYNGEAVDLNKFAHHVHGNHFIPNTVLVDCTADAKVASHYYEWLLEGIHVITPNKKANSGPLDQYLKLRALQRRSYTHYFYEATVGAGLPIISTLRGLLETGDQILRIEGIFSGTLSYIFNNFVGKKAFSEVVSEAKQAGYTEPDPRDDLSGTDVARKVIILARESGMKLELSDIPVQSYCIDRGLHAKLPEFDQDLATKRNDAESAGEVLRYVGVVDVVNSKGLVELRRYKNDHPFAQLSGSDNIIAFTTARYKEQPLIVRGPGAGAQVTAGGVFSDILQLASYLGAPS
ncbi:hypothetical protein Syun_003015 [Stephania yunnanensis]|uniref:ACT domain-containing protein n=1 Tax=Stephania yunnanensis TaxID=152371 RepID=A0AAP0PZT0_9MAGN